jgi:hypothetical protein
MRHQPSLLPAERGVRISRTTLSDMPKPGQAYEPEVTVKVREWISSAPAGSFISELDRRLRRQPE